MLVEDCILWWNWVCLLDRLYDLERRYLCVTIFSFVSIRFVVRRDMRLGVRFMCFFGGCGRRSFLQLV